MDSITGVIEKVEPKEGAKNGKAWKSFNFEIGGKRYSTFDADIGNKFKVGQCVTMQGEQNGAYWNMKTMEEAGPNVTTEKITRPYKDATTMYVSYAKDIFVALLPQLQTTPVSGEELMRQAIGLVIQAKAAFES